MTVTLANAANRMASQVLELAADGAEISPELKHSIGVLLNAANKRLMAGHDAASFLDLLRFVESARKAERASC